MTQKRIQRKRSAGWQMPKNTVYVGRPSKWGNPYHVGENYTEEVIQNGKVIYIQSWTDIDAQTAVDFFEDAIALGYPVIKYSTDDIVRELRGKNLACWCPLDQPCHADILLRIANAKGKAAK